MARTSFFVWQTQSEADAFCVGLEYVNDSSAMIQGTGFYDENKVFVQIVDKDAEACPYCHKEECDQQGTERFACADWRNHLSKGV